MPLDRLELVGIEPGRFRQDRVRDREFADVVEERAEADRVEAVGRQLEFLGDGEGHLLDPLRVAGGVRVLGLDGRVQRLDRLERALLEAVVRVKELARPMTEPLGLCPQQPGAAVDEEGERDVEREEDDRDGGPDQMAARRNEVLERLRVGVDLVGADGLAAAAGGDRRVDLEQVVEAEVPLDGVLVASQLVDGAGGVAGANGVAEVALELEPAPDAAAVAARPGEDTVGAATP